MLDFMVNLGILLIPFIVLNVGIVIGFLVLIIKALYKKAVCSREVFAKIIDFKRFYDDSNMCFKPLYEYTVDAQTYTYQAEYTSYKNRDRLGYTDMIYVNPNRRRMVLELPETRKAITLGVMGIGGLLLVELFFLFIII